MRCAGLEADEAVSASKGVRGTGHGLDGEAAAVDVGKRVAREQHEVPIALVDPERDSGGPVRIEERHTCEAVPVRLEIGERMVEPGAADRPREPEVVLGILHRLPFEGYSALVRESTLRAGMDRMTESTGAIPSVR